MELPATYRNSFMYKRLSNLEKKELEVIWLKIVPTKLRIENSPIYAYSMSLR